MAEIKNSFLRSKMNKDLDDRLVPNGEYRDAQNISVGKSEDDDIGALESVLGNTLISVSDLSNPNLEIIGYITDENNDSVYVFATDYSDGIGTYNSAPIRAASTNRCIIYSWTPQNPGNLNILVDNYFLNFSTTNPIQATLIEELLFFTDNRNQPRKISIDKGVDYYTSETQISVAKYNPYQPISLVKKATGIVAAAPAPTSTTLFLEPITTGITNAAITATSQVTLTTSNSSIQEGMIISGTGIVGLCSVVRINGDDITLNAVQTIGITITLSFHAAVELDMAVVSTNKTGDESILGDEFITVSAINNGVITLSQAPALVANNPTAEDIFIFLISTMTNKSGETTWPGDPDYLESKFVRFSYRFRFDDGEYSIFAPFTQIAYIPKQKGYYLNGDEDAAYRSTILTWMENNVDNVELLIPLPDKANTLGSSYKITDMDILYKESDALIVKVLETLPLTDIISTSNENICSYSYQSRKPYKTLTQAQTVRVYDKVPVRSLAQETAGNRIIYGNFYDIYTPPSTIDYTVSALAKKTISADNWIEYPNHSLKQNRNYQVGFVLCDKYGRQSSVLLSPVTTDNITVGALGSTVYSPYHTAADNITVRDWFGDALQVVVNDEIESNNAGGSKPNFTTGEPGLYAIRTGTGLGWSVDATTATTITNNIYTFALTGITNTVVPVAGDFLRGEYTDYVEVISSILALGIYTVTTGLNGIANTAAVVNSSYMNNYQNTPDLKWAYSINSTGWYSYKIVVKQTEQDYYNVYLPGILKGYPDQAGVASPIPFPGISTDPEGSTSNIVLINDNINKVPRDLTEVGPDQKQFRSSVQLFGRVENTIAATGASNVQFYPGTDTDTAISIATTEDSNMAFANLSAEGQANIYQIDSKPLIARLATSTGIGVVSTTVTATNMTPYLAIYETEPVESLLDIYWETTTVGMLSDLNEDVSTGFEGPTSLSFDFSTFTEAVVPGAAITDLAWPTSNEGAVFNAGNHCIATAFSVTNSAGTPRLDDFILYQDPATKKFQIKTGAVSNGKPTDAYFTYKNDSITTGIYTFSITLKVVSTEITNTISFQGSFTNIDPIFSPALALITKTVDETAIGTLTAFNGTNTSNTLVNKKAELQWTITAGNPTGVDLLPAFAIGASDGVLTQRENNTPNGLYSLTITLEDSVFGGVQGTGGETITGTQQVRIGPTPVNSGVKSTPCIATADATAIFPTHTTIAPWDASSTLTAMWFLSDTVTAGAARTTYLQGTGWPDAGALVPSGTNGVFTGTGGGAGTVSCNTIHKLGDELTQGTVVFSLNMQLNYNSAYPPPSGIEGSMDSWKVYHRIDNTQAWAIIPDTNNHTMPAAGIKRSGSNGPQLQTFAVTDSYYLQYVLAYDAVGEYLIVAENTSSDTASQQSQALLTYVNSNDLNYSTCVIENGVDTSGGTATTYEYGISGSTGSYGCSFGLTSIYSNIAYGQYINQFFTTSSLTTAYPFVTDATDGSGTTHTNFYSYKMKVGPYREATADYKYSFSTRFTTGAGNLAKVYNPPSWGTACYIQNCGNMATASNQLTEGCYPQALTYPYTIDTTTVG